MSLEIPSPRPGAIQYRVLPEIIYGGREILVDGERLNVDELLALVRLMRSQASTFAALNLSKSPPER